MSFVFISYYNGCMNSNNKQKKKDIIQPLPISFKEAVKAVFSPLKPTKSPKKKYAR